MAGSDCWGLCAAGRRAGRKVFVFGSVWAIKTSGTLPLDLLRGHMMAILPLSAQVQREVQGERERERERERKGEREKSMRQH